MQWFDIQVYIVYRYKTPLSQGKNQMLSLRGISVQLSSLLRIQKVIPLLSPIHRKVQGNKRGRPIEYRALKSPPRVENSGVAGTSEWSKSVGRYGVGGDSLLNGGAEVTPIVSEILAWWLYVSTHVDSIDLPNERN